MAKKQKNRKIQSTIAFIKKRSKKKGKKARSNPFKNLGGMLKGQSGELVRMVGPTLGAYVAARIVARLSRNIVGRVPFLAKHAGPLSNVALLAGTLWATDRMKSARRYRTQLVIGVAISTLQSILKTYVPGLGNLLDESTSKPGSHGALGAFGDEHLLDMQGPGYAEGLSGGDHGASAGVDVSRDLRDLTWTAPRVAGATTDGDNDAALYTGAFARG